MTQSTSSIPLVKERLLWLMDREPELANVQLIFGPDERDSNATNIALADTVSWNREWRGIGAKRSSETYGLNLYIRVRDAGLSQREATDRAFELLSVLDNLFIDQVGLKGEIEGVDIVALRPVELLETPTTEGHAAFIDAIVDVTARI